MEARDKGEELGLAAIKPKRKYSSKKED